MSASSRCGVVLVDNQTGYECGGPGTEVCFDCGIDLCDLHTEECELCDGTLCGCCIHFHLREPHTRKPAAIQQVPQRRSA